MRRSISVAILVVLLVGLVPVSSPTFAKPNDAPILLKAARFRPGLGEKPDLPPGLIGAEPAQGKPGYYLVQFAGPIQPAWKAALVDAGGEIVSYVPEFAFKVRMAPDVAARVRRLESVAWVGVFHPGYKISPNVTHGGVRLYTVHIERGGDLGASAAAIAHSGAQVWAQEGNVLLVAADTPQLDAVARVLDVAWVQDLSLQEKHNEYGAGAIMGADVANGLGYDGSTQIVAVADSGLGDGTFGGAHPDIPADRIVAIYDWEGTGGGACYNVVSDGAQDVDSGHGTHVAASVLGAGGLDGRGRGSAPGAGLVFQAVEDYAVCYGAPGYYLLGIPSDIRLLFQQAYGDGARIHSDSWGHLAWGEYDLDAADADDFVWNHPDMAIVFSAGNTGVDGNRDGIVDLGLMGSPATAKNIITVGASENDRAGNYDCDTGLGYADCSGQNDVLTYGEAWPGDFAVDPIASDPSAGNAEQMAAFSSRGPTSDGRIKPDVVAPGTWVLSGYSDLYQQGYDGSPNPQNGAWQYDGWGYPLDAAYKYMGGTSMAAPLVAGGAAVVRDYYAKTHSHDASAALVKATLINSAVDLLDENNDGADDNDYPIPNNHEGWGRIDLAAATDGSRQFVEETDGLGTGQTRSYLYTLGTRAELKVSLVWSDYPSDVSAAINLVNDLDLVVTAPDNTVYRGNVFSGGWSSAGGSADRINNVENVYVASAEVGQWTVEVSGYNVPDGPQPFAVVVSSSEGVDSSPAVHIVDPSAGETISGTHRVLVDATDDFAVTDVALSIDGATYITITASHDGTYYYYDWDTAASTPPTYPDGDHTLIARAVDDAGQQTESTLVSVEVDNVNEAPVAAFIVLNGGCLGRTCNVDASSSYDPDGTIASYVWDFGDDETGVGQVTSHTYQAPGTYTITLTVTDNREGMDTHEEMVDAIVLMHIADLDVTGVEEIKGKWRAEVTITVHDEAHVPAAGATVTGTWSVDGWSIGGTSCTTVGGGQCSVTSPLVKGNVPEIVFRVNNMVPSRVYDAVANHDPDGDSDGTSITVSKDGPVDPPPANQPPDASFSYDCTDLTCSFDASESSDLDGFIASYVWDFGDDGDPVSVSEEEITHEYAEQRVYEVVLTVVDDLGATGEDTQTVDLGGGSGGPTMHVGDLDGQSEWVRNKWIATVTITVLDADDSPVTGAEVTGDWGSCDTLASGQCTITEDGISAKTSSVSFTVSNVSHPGYTYNSGENRDPDGESTGTSIVIERPLQE